MLRQTEINNTGFTSCKFWCHNLGENVHIIRAPTAICQLAQEVDWTSAAARATAETNLPPALLSRTVTRRIRSFLNNQKLPTPLGRAAEGGELRLLSPPRIKFRLISLL